jgi:hypothetical protein
MITGVIPARRAPAPRSCSRRGRPVIRGARGCVPTIAGNRRHPVLHRVETNPGKGPHVPSIEECTAPMSVKDGERGD